MSDELNSTMPSGPAAPVPPAVQPVAPSKGTGRIVGLVIGLGVLAIVAGIVVAIVLFVFGGEPADEVEVRVGESQTEATAQTGTPQTTASTTAQASPEVANAEVFTFRDIFEPLLKPIPAPMPSDTTTDTDTDTDAPAAADTLYLNDIVTEDGVLKAVLELDGQTYTLAAGEAITGTPWEVLRVTDTQVTMLYGDTQVTLTIGQGITK